MASIEITIRDEQGNIVYQGKPRNLEMDKPGLHEIEGAVQQWRRVALPEIEAQLLEQAQSQFTEEQKSRSCPM
ncbi:MAG TPA: hypothetical protein V6C65_27010 [Allocoleopsis sp.]